MPEQPKTMRMAIRRVSPPSALRVGFSIGWIISLLPALLFSGGIAWVLHGIWTTLDGWSPWTPWSANTKLAGFTLPTPEFRPREALHVDGFYQRLEPLGQHPLLSVLLGTVLGTILGGVLIAIIFWLAANVFNFFGYVTGGLQIELVAPTATDEELPPRRQSSTSAVPQKAATKRPQHDKTTLRW
jgi:hypothetical protein